jgi:hypothetical protein
MLAWLASSACCIRLRILHGHDRRSTEAGVGGTAHARVISHCLVR